MSEFSLIFDITKEQIIAHSHPYLRQNRIWAGSQEGFDFKVLLDSFKEQFNIPTGFIDIGNCFSR